MRGLELVPGEPFGSHEMALLDARSGRAGRRMTALARALVRADEDVRDDGADERDAGGHLERRLEAVHERLRSALASGFARR